MMNIEKMLQSFLEINNASEISEAILRTVCDNLSDDHLEWLIAGALEQLEKIKKATESIDKAMMGKAGRYEREYQKNP